MMKSPINTHIVVRATVVAGTLLIALASQTRAAQESESSGQPQAERNPQATFTFDHLDPEAAQLMVLQHCAANAGGSCQLLQIAGGGPAGGKIRVAGSAKELADIGALIAERDRLGSKQRFQVAMIEATAEGEHMLEGLSGGARDALLDAASLLPFRGLVLRDVGLVETADRAQTTIAGPGSSDYYVQFSTLPVVTADTVQILVNRFLVIRDANVVIGEEHVAGGRRQILETSFEITPGETVVVGTSRLDGGDSAVIVLVTAVAESDD